MNVDAVLIALNDRQVEYLLIGGMNFLLRHQPVMTFDIDVWIHDTSANRKRCEQALADLCAEWGPTEAEWRAVSTLAPDWLARQSMFCLTTLHGALDVFRVVPGLSSWPMCAATAVECRTGAGVICMGLCDADMLRCQEALAESDRKLDRIAFLRNRLQAGPLS